jgi:hypothetical protein
MKRWIWIPAAVILAFGACDDKDGKPASHSTGAAGAAPVQANADSSGRTGAASSEALTRTLAYADAPPPADDASAAAAASRFFDGAALHGAGFAVPGDGSGAVYAGAGSSRRPLLTNAGLTTRPASRGLDASAPPLPDSASFPTDDAASARGADKILAAFEAFQTRMFDAAAPIVSRAGWGAAKRKGTPVEMTPTHVTVHHTDGVQTMTEAATMAEVRSIQQYHMAGRATEGKDVWDDIGYHFLIDGAGRVVEGRPADTVGAHARGANGNNVGIAMMGNFEKIQPTAAQIESLTRLVSFLALKYNQNPTRDGFLEGHRHYDDTDCPGRNMMAILASLRQKIGTETVALAARLKNAPKGEFVPVVTDA